MEFRKFRVWEFAEGAEYGSLIGEDLWETEARLLVKMAPPELERIMEPMNGGEFV
ncbi:hypothetical protein [Tumebacillus algifaecis]|uniref:hypothetical protein n=1 Tax=Tumebacillus algifaecis TaxID=1214604 RepID=UPI0012FD448D|nr:hypothetical protein [Tumebacillus algifaecis]